MNAYVCKWLLGLPDWLPDWLWMLQQLNVEKKRNQIIDAFKKE